MKYINSACTYPKMAVCAFFCAACLIACHRRVEPIVLTEEFADFPEGPLLEYVTADFIWKSDEGSAEITGKKSKFTPRSLRINGGEKKAVIVEPAKDIGRPETLTFWAERWTRRDPFEFRVLGYSDNGWDEIFNGDREILTGDFPSLVEVSLHGNAYSQYKLICSSPENTGMLIDDFKIFNDAPLKYDAVSVRHVHVPVLKRNENTPVLLVQIHTTGAAGTLNLKELNIDLSASSDVNDIEKVSVFYTGNNPAWGDGLLVSESGDIREHMNFKCNQALKRSANHFWICVNLSENALLSNKIDAGCNKLDIDGDEIIPDHTNPPGKSYLGIALRKHNDDDVHTYRIPGLATTNNGTLIAVYDIRRNNSTDLQEDIDVGMSRSTDGGYSWEPMKVIMDMEEWGGLPNEENGIGDPAILVDRETNTIWVAAVWAHGHPGKRNWWASGPGMNPSETSQFMLVKSEDDGLTWSEELNITRQIKDPKWHLLLQGPGKGITMKDGTLVFPAQFKDENEMPHSTLIWSKDHGKSWQIGVGAKENTTEAQVIEQDNGHLMLNMRDNRNRSDSSKTNGRSVYITKDLGRSWVKHQTSRTNALRESTCQASIIKEDFIAHEKRQSLVLFSNPDTKKGRNHISVKVSFDDGERWDLSKTLLLDEGAGRGYSCMTKIDDHTIGILYEGSQADLTFQRISVGEIIGH
ncbi:MAG: exo-alpha-sialidase [Cytophagales bacterium]|nr:exo-alpha-sialidase [Cytophagales bacterium]